MVAAWSVLHLIFLGTTKGQIYIEEKSFNTVKGVDKEFINFCIAIWKESIKTQI